MFCKFFLVWYQWICWAHCLLIVWLKLVEFFFLSHWPTFWLGLQAINLFLFRYDLCIDRIYFTTSISIGSKPSSLIRKIQCGLLFWMKIPHGLTSSDWSDALLSCSYHNSGHTLLGHLENMSLCCNALLNYIWLFFSVI